MSSAAFILTPANPKDTQGGPDGAAGGNIHLMPLKLLSHSSADTRKNAKSTSCGGEIVELLISACARHAVRLPWPLRSQNGRDEEWWHWGGHVTLVWLSLSQPSVYSSLPRSKGKIALKGEASCSVVRYSLN